MSTGKLRKEILDACPEDFTDELSGWIDDVESRLSDALGSFDIDGVDELHKIEDAKRSIEELKDDLY